MMSLNNIHGVHTKAFEKSYISKPRSQDYKLYFPFPPAEVHDALE